MARHSTFGLLFIFVALIALLFIFLTLIMPRPALAQSVLKTKTRMDVAGSTCPQAPDSRQRQPLIREQAGLISNV